MAPTFAPFKILGIGADATNEEVKRAYRAMASKYHPDAGGDVWVFQQVQAAYESVLNQRATAAAPKKNSKASNYGSEHSPQSSPDGGSATRHPGPEQVKSKQSDPPEVDVRGSSTPMPSKRSRSQPEGKNDPKTQRGALASSSSLRQVLFGHLPLQNETSVFLLVSALVRELPSWFTPACSQRSSVKDG